MPDDESQAAQTALAVDGNGEQAVELAGETEGAAPANGQAVAKQTALEAFMAETGITNPDDIPKLYKETQSWANRTNQKLQEVTKQLEAQRQSVAESQEPEIDLEGDPLGAIQYVVQKAIAEQLQPIQQNFQQIQQAQAIADGEAEVMQTPWGPVLQQVRNTPEYRDALMQVGGNVPAALMMVQFQKGPQAMAGVFQAGQESGQKNEEAKMAAQTLGNEGVTVSGGETLDPGDEILAAARRMAGKHILGV